MRGEDEEAAERMEKSEGAGGGRRERAEGTTCCCLLSLHVSSSSVNDRLSILSLFFSSNTRDVNVYCFGPFLINWIIRFSVFSTHYVQYSTWSHGLLVRLRRPAK